MRSIEKSLCELLMRLGVKGAIDVNTQGFRKCIHVSEMDLYVSTDDGRDKTLCNKILFDSSSVWVLNSSNRTIRSFDIPAVLYFGWIEKTVELYRYDGEVNCVSPASAAKPVRDLNVVVSEIRALLDELQKMRRS